MTALLSTARQTSTGTVYHTTLSILYCIKANQTRTGFQKIRKIVSWILKLFADLPKLTFIPKDSDIPIVIDLQSYLNSLTIYKSITLNGFLDTNSVVGCSGQMKVQYII